MDSLPNNYDDKLKEIMVQENDSLPGFFNAVFGFLSRYCPEKIYNTSHISGEHLINQSFTKWREKYLQEKMQEGLQIAQSEEGTPPVVAEEVVITQNAVENQKKIADHAEIKSSGSNAKLSKSSKGDVSFDTANGAMRDSYGWNQTIEDLEVRILVPSTIKKGKQVKVHVQTGSLDVSIQESSSWRNIISGKLSHNIKAEESVWSLVPGENVLINLEKKEERWWDRLLSTEDPIDLNNIDAERDFSTLPQEEQEKIRELVWNKRQQEQGKPTSDRLKMESMLREAWNAEGSPFKGQDYDPTKINFATGSNFSMG